MIDQDKMRALATRLREDYDFSLSITSTRYRDAVSRTPIEAADAIDLLLAEVEAASSPGVRLASARREIDKLRAELEAAAADKRDAERWRIVHETIPESELWDIGVIVAHENGVSTCNAHAFKCVELIDAALGEKNANHSDK